MNVETKEGARCRPHGDEEMNELQDGQPPTRGDDDGVRGIRSQNGLKRPWERSLVAYLPPPQPAWRRVNAGMRLH